MQQQFSKMSRKLPLFYFFFVMLFGLTLIGLLLLFYLDMVKFVKPASSNTI